MIGIDGLGSYSGVILDLAGNLYGTSSGGGIHDRGAVFQLTPTQDGSWTENVIYSFNSDRKDGMSPGSGLIFSQAGNLYGATMSGQKQPRGIT